MINPTSLCQIEIQVSDLERAVEFYEKVFGWVAVPADMHNYVVLEVPPKSLFGVSLTSHAATSTQFGSRLVIYFPVEDFSPYLESTLRAGGCIALAPRKVIGYGEICQITDPDGQRWGLFRKSSSLREGV